VSTPRASHPPSTAPAFGTRTIAWLGGAWFVLSLLYFVWWYAVVLDRPVTGVVFTWTALVWNVTLFSAFALHHSLMARTPMKRWLGSWLPPSLERTAYVWVASVLFVVVCSSWQRLPGVVYEAPAPLRWMLGAAQLAGVVLTVAAARVLDGLALAGIRQATGQPTPVVIRLVWPFTLVRHPIYLGWVLLVFAATPMTVDRLVFALTSTVYLLISMPWEERSLSAAAGPAYPAYCRRVRWRILPGVY